MDVIRRGVSPGGESDPSLLLRARKNKVELELMRCLNITDRLREYQESRLAAFLRSTAEVASKMAEFDYAVIKFFKPVAYVPSDLDLLVAVKDFARARRALRSLGFEYVVSEPNCTTMRRDIQVDIYTNPDFLNLPYLGGKSLLEYTRSASINGVQARALSDEIEAVLICAHSIYKEHLLTLNDYFSLKKFLGRSSIKMARALNVQPAVDFCLSTIGGIDAGDFEAPFKVPLSIVSRIWWLKFIDDTETRRGMRNLLAKLFDTRLASLAVSRVRRETY
jgi:hypothetical protein